PKIIPPCHCHEIAEPLVCHFMCENLVDILLCFRRRTFRIKQKFRFVVGRSEEHTSELQSHLNLVCRLLLEKNKKLDCSCVGYQPSVKNVVSISLSAWIRRKINNR